jgi:hypothetical protein
MAPQRHEPAVHPAIKNGFLFVPTAGMRLAPEVLVHELFREVFFEKHYEQPRARDLTPRGVRESASFNTAESEATVLMALRGRKKVGRQAHSTNFFAPAYPSLSRHGWLRKSSDRVVRDLLLAGALAQYYSGAGDDREDRREEQLRDCDSIVLALAGHRSASTEHLSQCDILSVPIRNVAFTIDKDECAHRISSAISTARRSFHSEGDDPLATRIHDDVIALCDLEAHVPRLRWIQLLMTFLRLALPIWLLASMRLTVILRDWLVSALEGNGTPSEAILLAAIANRHTPLLHPTTTPTDEVRRHVQAYMRARVETTIVLNLLEEAGLDCLKSRVITSSSNRSGEIALADLLVKSAGCRTEFSRKLSGLTPRQALTRAAESYTAWKLPLRKGQGKNYDEFLRVLRKADQGDEGRGYLLTPSSNASERGFVVFPGSALVALIASLADRAKAKRQGIAQKGQLLLGDVEAHFHEYGIDFYSSAGARPQLLGKLQEMGLLRGSPDAGDSAQLAVPFQRLIGGGH